MTQTPLASLIETARQFYPSGIAPADERYTETPEYLRARDAWRRALRDSESWPRVLSLLRERVGPGHALRDLTVPYMHPSRRVAVVCEGTPFMAVGCVSVLAPVFFCYGLEGPGQEPEVRLNAWPREGVHAMSIIARTLHEVFEFEPLSLETALTIIPGVELERSPFKGPTLLDALISNDLNHYV